MGATWPTTAQAAHQPDAEWTASWTWHCTGRLARRGWATRPWRPTATPLRLIRMQAGLSGEVSRVNVRSIYRPYVVAVDGNERLAQAAARMQDQQVGALVVMVDDRFAGILTERDLTRAIVEGPIWSR